MVALEISYIYNLLKDEWRHLLTGALTLDLIAVLGYSLMAEPSPVDYPVILGEPPAMFFPTLFLFAAGTASAASSLVTLYYARIYDLFAQGATGKFVVQPSAEHDDRGNSNSVSDGSPK